jgi:hypothetical protein
LKWLKWQELIIDRDWVLNPKLHNTIPPIHMTQAELRGYWWGFTRNWIYIWDENNFYDLVSFWNLRALWIDIEFLPQNHLWRNDRTFW